MEDGKTPGAYLSPLGDSNGISQPQVSTNHSINGAAHTRTHTHTHTHDSASNSVRRYLELTRTTLMNRGTLKLLTEEATQRHPMTAALH